MAVPIVDQNGQVVPDLFGGGDISAAVADVILDRFFGGAQSASGNNTNANLGEKQWNCVLDAQTGTVTRVQSEAGHLGEIRLAAHATLGSREAIYLGHSAVAGHLCQVLEMVLLRFVVKVVGSGRFRFGVGNDAAAAGLGTQTLNVSADHDVIPNWRCRAADGVGFSDIDSGVPVVVGEWIEWRIGIVPVGASGYKAQYTANGVLVAEITDNLPANNTLMAPAYQAITITPGPFPGIGDIDTFELVLR